MDFNQASGLLLQLVLLCILGRVSATPFQCSHWPKVFPNCPCIPVLDEKGEELPNVAVVDCSSKSLTSVPQKKDDVTFTLHELRLSNNQITTLPRNAFQGVKIRHINLAGNRMGDIHDDAFSGLEQYLKILEIEGNSASEPQINAIGKLVKLEELTMKNYTVSHLGPKTENGIKMYPFNSFTVLSKLTLDNWGIESIDAHAFLNGGTSNSLRRLTLLNHKLSSLPVDVLTEAELQNLETLHISHTQISRISPFAFSKLAHVKEIILSDNAIGTIESNSFKGVGDTLEKIDLSNNVLGTAGKNDLSHLEELHQLQELILHNNELVSVPTMDSIGSGQPFKLDLSNNKIDKLSANGLTHFGQRLQSLDLSLNKIDEIDSQIFSGATLLQSLVLTYQIGTSSAALKVPTSLTQAANSLTYLDVSGQKVEPQSLWQTLKKLKKLETLILHSVELTQIPDFAFQNLPLLTTLELSFNTIKQITEMTFVGPRSLEKLTLHSISISALPPCLFYKYEYSNKLSLDLGSNSITCDCSIKTLLENYHSDKVTFPDEKSIPTCKDSSLLTKKNLDQLECGPEHCVDYYLTTLPPQPETTSTPLSTQPSTPTVDIQVQKGTTSITVTWTTTNIIDFKSYVVTASTQSRPVEGEEISLVGTIAHKFVGLTADTFYVVCIQVNFNERKPIKDCVTVSTNEDDDATTGGQDGKDDPDDANVGIIVGCVVGILALLAIIAAIVYIAIIRRRPKKLAAPKDMMGPVQPRAFAKSELPSMNGDSRSFVKAKKNGAAPEPKAIGGMRVVAISDGQTGPSSGGRVGRANLMSPDGTYEPMDKFKSKDQNYEPMEKQHRPMRGEFNSAYENDHGSLPSTPTKEKFHSSPPSTPGHGGYVNEAFSKYEEVTV